MLNGTLCTAFCKQLTFVHPESSEGENDRRNYSYTYLQKSYAGERRLHSDMPTDCVIEPCINFIILLHYRQVLELFYLGSL